MSRVLDVLFRLRDHARKSAEVELRRAESDRDRQLARVHNIRAALVTAREECAHDDPRAVESYFAFRLQGELAIRREEARLVQREREVEARDRVHVGTVRDELAVDNLRELRAEAEAREAGRKERATMDDIGGRLQRVS